VDEINQRHLDTLAEFPEITIDREDVAPGIELLQDGNMFCAAS
jgi:hypothetical protein